MDPGTAKAEHHWKNWANLTAPHSSAETNEGDATDPEDVLEAEDDTDDDVHKGYESEDEGDVSDENDDIGEPAEEMRANED